MKTLLKYTTAAALAGVLAVAMASPSQARHGRNAAAIGGFVAGAVVGSAVANSNNGYYYNEPSYAYEPGYSYSQPRYYSGPGYYDGNTGCTTSGNMYGHRQDYSACY